MARRKKVKSNKASIASFFNSFPGEVSARAYSSLDKVSRKIVKDVYDLSQEYVPVDEGDLKASGRIEKKKRGHFEVIYYVSKDGRNYAYYVHENIVKSQPYGGGPTTIRGAEGNQKNYTKPGTGAKYLERAADEVGSRSDVVGALRDEKGRFKRKLPKFNG